MPDEILPRRELLVADLASRFQVLSRPMSLQTKNG